jgi:hypothetical protein
VKLDLTLKEFVSKGRDTSSTVRHILLPDDLAWIRAPHTSLQKILESPTLPKVEIKFHVSFGRKVIYLKVKIRANCFG